jgi:hypothetical protein
MIGSSVSPASSRTAARLARKLEYEKVLFTESTDNGYFNRGQGGSPTSTALAA